MDLEKRHAETECVAAWEVATPNREAASREERVAAGEAEPGRARAVHTQAPDTQKGAHGVPLVASEDGSAQALSAEREQQTALAKATGEIARALNAEQEK